MINLKIPLDRVGVAIGPNGVVKKQIDKICEVSLAIDGQSGDVGIISTNPNDPSGVLKAQNVVTAVGRGFSPDKAFLLFSDDQFLDIIDLREYLGKSTDAIKRIKGRLIGSKGKTWKLIEELSGVQLSVYGHTVAIIGYLGRIEIAKEAVRMLIQGSQHGTVYAFLLSKRRELKKAKIELWEKRGTNEGKVGKEEE
jgi:ribosomal RNA assembly protein